MNYTLEQHVLYRDWVYDNGNARFEWVKVEVVKLGPKRVRIRLADGHEQWAEQRNLKPLEEDVKLQVGDKVCFSRDVTLGMLAGTTTIPNWQHVTYYHTEEAQIIGFRPGELNAIVKGMDNIELRVNSDWLRLLPKDQSEQIAELEQRVAELAKALKGIGDLASEAQEDWLGVEPAHAPDWTHAYKSIIEDVDEVLNQ